MAIITPRSSSTRFDRRAKPRPYGAFRLVHRGEVPLGGVRLPGSELLEVWAREIDLEIETAMSQVRVQVQVWTLPPIGRSRRYATRRRGRIA